MELTSAERLFRLPGPARIFYLFLIATMCGISSAILSLPGIESYLHTASSVSVFLMFSLLMLLLAVHAHYIRVRSETSPFSRLRPDKQEYMGLVHDILYHQEFLRLKDYFHHSSHIYDHVLRVSYFSYAVTKVLCLDYRAAARGGLLHDFFLYDWRQRKASDPRRSLHGREHPRIAFQNASEHFFVSKREKDIIIKHMFPKTIAPPRYLESLIVSLCDKVAALIEFCRPKRLEAQPETD